jgi:hypothetical protein
MRHAFVPGVPAVALEPELALALFVAPCWTPPSTRAPATCATTGPVARHPDPDEEQEQGEMDTDHRALTGLQFLTRARAGRYDKRASGFEKPSCSRIRATVTVAGSQLAAVRRDRIGAAAGDPRSSREAACFG